MGLEPYPLHHHHDIICIHHLLIGMMAKIQKSVPTCVEINGMVMMDPDANPQHPHDFGMGWSLGLEPFCYPLHHDIVCIPVLKSGNWAEI